MGTKKIEWYLPNPQNYDEPLGPYTSKKVLSLIQETHLGLDDFIWAKHLSETAKWSRVFEIDDFTKLLKKYPKSKVPLIRSQGISSQENETKIDFNFEKAGEYGVENLYRRFPRAPMENEVIIHNQKILCIGHSIDISEKGCFVEHDKPEHFEKGEEIIITFVNCSPLGGTISICGTIMNIIHSGELKGHGIYFLRLNPNIKRKIAAYVIHNLEKKMKQSA